MLTEKLLKITFGEDVVPSPQVLVWMNMNCVRFSHDRVSIQRSLVSSLAL